MLRDVREALGDEVVRGDLDRLREAFVDRDTQSDRHRRTRGELLESDRETVTADDGRVNPERDLAELSERRGDLLSRPGKALAGAVIPQLLLEQAELERQRDQPLLRAVVQVPLESLPLLLTCLDHSRARST